MKHRNSKFRDNCLTVPSEKEGNILKSEMIMGPCGASVNKRHRFRYYPKERHLRWAEDEKYFVTNLGSALYLRERINTKDYRGQKWVFFSGWEKPSTDNIFRPDK